MSVKKVCFQETQILGDIFRKTQSGNSDAFKNTQYGNSDTFRKTKCGNSDVLRMACSTRKKTFDAI